ncbi:BrnA antitoxin family protein [Caulobacter segnis]
MNSESVWIDPDDSPEWTAEHFDRAEFSIGSQVIRPATGTYTRPGRPKSNDPKQQVTLRLDRAVLEKLREGGPGWQSRINEILRKAVGA